MPLCKKCGAKDTAKWRANNLIRNRLTGIMSRCYNPNFPKYPIYGGRGITVCEEWRNNPQAFIDWALTSGFKKGLQIDRMDNDKGYSPENCHWVTNRVNCRNKRDKVTDYVKKTRICYVCKIEKPFSEYHKNKLDSAGIYKICKDCRRKIKR